MRRISMRSLPMPRIILPLDLLRPRPRAKHSFDRAVEPGENCLADKEMADIQLDDRRDGGDRAHGFETEPVARMAFEAERLGKPRRSEDAAELVRAARA